MADDLPGSEGQDGQDVCSYLASIFHQRQSMERLLNWLRESQTTCTDTNCFDDFNQGLPGREQANYLIDEDFIPPNNINSENLLSDTLNFVLWFALMLLTLYAMSLRQGGRDMAANGEAIKASGNNSGQGRRDPDRDNGGREL